MRDKTANELMQEIVYELKTIAAVCILTSVISTITMLIACGYIVFFR